jgi:hypothetical protein
MSRFLMCGGNLDRRNGYHLPKPSVRQSKWSKIWSHFLKANVCKYLQYFQHWYHSAFANAGEFAVRQTTSMSMSVNQIHWRWYIVDAELQPANQMTGPTNVFESTCVTLSQQRQQSTVFTTTVAMRSCIC